MAPIVVVVALVVDEVVVVAPLSLSLLLVDVASVVDEPLSDADIEPPPVSVAPFDSLALPCVVVPLVALVCVVEAVLVAESLSLLVVSSPLQAPNTRAPAASRRSCVPLIAAPIVCEPLSRGRDGAQARTGG
ncbi:MAG: hypothetical protein R3A79_27110 [Nannocystaceae bacterium]